jgi:hypothetical protein
MVLSFALLEALRKGVGNASKLKKNATFLKPSIALS